MSQSPEACNGLPLRKILCKGLAPPASSTAVASESGMVLAPWLCLNKYPLGFSIPINQGGVFKEEFQDHKCEDLGQSPKRFTLVPGHLPVLSQW